MRALDGGPFMAEAASSVPRIGVLIGAPGKARPTSGVRTVGADLIWRERDRPIALRGAFAAVMTSLTLEDFQC